MRAFHWQLSCPDLTIQAVEWILSCLHVAKTLIIWAQSWQEAFKRVRGLQSLSPSFDRDCTVIITLLTTWYMPGFSLDKACSTQICFKAYPTITSSDCPIYTIVDIFKWDDNRFPYGQYLCIYRLSISVSILSPVYIIY
jgi:hypothetical protein